MLERKDKMATFKTVNSTDKYKDDNAICDVLNYILNINKTPHNYIGFCSLDPMCNLAEQMMTTSEFFNKSSGVRLRHWIVSFSPKEINKASVVNEIASKISSYIGANFQTVYAVHEDKTHLHFHLVHNAVSYVDGHRFYGTRADFYAFENFLKSVCAEYGIKKVMYVQTSSDI